MTDTTRRVEFTIEELKLLESVIIAAFEHAHTLDPGLGLTERLRSLETVVSRELMLAGEPRTP